MATETKPREADNVPEMTPPAKTEGKTKVRRTARSTTRKSADTEKSDASADREKKAPDAEAARPENSEAVGSVSTSDRRKNSPDQSSGGPDRAVGQGGDRDSAAHERGDSSDDRGGGYRGSDRRGRRGDSQGGFRKKSKKGSKKGRGRMRNETPGWIQPLPPGEIIQVYGDMPDLSLYTDLEDLASKAAEIERSGEEPIALDKVDALNVTELTAFVQERGIAVEGRPSRLQMIRDLFKFVREKNIPVIDRGHLDLTDEGHGYVVHGSKNYRLMPESSLLPAVFIRAFGLKRGHDVEVLVRPPEEGVRCSVVLSLKSVMGRDPGTIADITPFEDLTPYYPTERILLEIPPVEKPSRDVSMRVFDILTPIGFGQRGLIVAPPRTGKTILLQGIANAVATNSPEARLIVLLVDERPEEVTDFRRNVRGEVVSSTFDESPESHVHAAEMVISKARRLIEIGEHVVILLDSITRLARAYNALASNSGKIMSGGLEATALQKPKRFFGAARNIEGGGSLTIMGSALVDTGSRMDEVIFEEFKGTGNMEVHLDRDLVNKRIFPSINVEQSGTRKEELLYHPEELNRIYSLRRIMQGVPPSEAMEMLITRLRKTVTNAEFLMSLNR
jgi:transcription termination factor Rho